MSAPSGLDSELESFRQQWLSDLRTRRDEPSHAPSSRPEKPAAPRSPTRRRRSRVVDADDDDDDFVPVQAYDDAAPPLHSGHTLDGTVRPAPPRELVSALDHFEEAMEKEALGNMGDSLKLYRQAYRLDNRVDKRYREKHFPNVGAATSKPPPKAASSSLSAIAATSADSAAGSLAPQEPAAEPQALSIADLISSFSALSIPPAPPEVEHTPPPPCPMASLPEELLVHILADLAAADPGALAAAALVCRRLAYLVATEQRLWRRVALGHEFGFPAMHHRFARAVDWGELHPSEEEECTENEDGTLVSPRELLHRRQQESVRVATALIPAAYPSWKDMFRARPRVRFNGCYISTVNYVRTGQQSTNQATWGGAPIHIVTYYRYLRFLRDGAVISLLTTSPPPDVVPHLTRDLLLLHRGREHHTHLPSAPMRDALRGRWRLSPSLRPPSKDPRAATSEGEEYEGDLFIETEGVGEKYTFLMDLALRSAGRASRNNKIVWRGHYSYNKLTDDRAEFLLKNDKPFYFSRVRSYGTGA